MGTRSFTVMHGSWSDHKEIAVLYRQMDGYPLVHGKELKDFLKDMAIVNGISVDAPRMSSNGGYCLAAQIIAHFKEEIGSFYLHAAGTRDIGEEYIYYIYPSVGKLIRLKVEAYGEIIFDGEAKDFDVSAM